MPTHTDASRQPATRAADRGRGSQPGAPTGRPATGGEPLSVKILALSLRLAQSENALGCDATLLAELGVLVSCNAAEVIEALQKAEDERRAQFPRFPFSWGLTSDERIVLRALLTEDHVSGDELDRIADSAGHHGEQRVRKLIYSLRKKMRAVDARFEIVTVVRQGRCLRPSVRKLLLDLMAGR